MPEVDTIIIRPADAESTVEAVRRLCTDLQVGGIVLSEEIDLGGPFELVPILAKGIPAEDVTLNELGTPIPFSNTHEWHLAYQASVVSLRLWQHKAGVAKFRVARALPGIGGIDGYYGSDEQAVLEASFANPAEYVPQVGDTFIFVDKGCPPITGTSSHHRVDALETDGVERLSIARDVFFDTTSLV